MSTRYKIDGVRPERVNSMRLHEASFRERLYDNLMQIVYEESILGKIFERLEGKFVLYFYIIRTFSFMTLLPFIY